MRKVPFRTSNDVYKFLDFLSRKAEDKAKSTKSSEIPSDSITIDKLDSLPSGVPPQHEVVGVGSNLYKTSDRITPVLSEVNILKTNISDMNSEVDTITESISDLESSVGAISTDLTSIGESIGTLVASIEAVDSKVTNNTSKLESVETLADTLNTTLNDLSSTVTNNIESINRMERYHVYEADIVSTNIASGAFGNRSSVVVDTANVRIYLPEIVDNTTVAMEGQKIIGNKISIHNISSGTIKLYPYSDQVYWLNAEASSEDFFELSSGCLAETIAVKKGDVFGWSIIPSIDKTGITDILSTHSDKIAALETGIGEGGATTFTGLTDTPANYTGSANKVVAVNSDASGLHFVDMSTEDSHPPLPETLVPDTYLIINEDGTGFSCSDETVTEVGQIINNTVSGITNGNQYVNFNCMGSNPVFTSGTITSERFKQANSVFVTPSSSSRSGTLPDIQNHNIDVLDGTSVREGKVLYIANQHSSNSFIIKSKRSTFSSNQKIRVGGTDYDEYTLKAGRTVRLEGYVFDDGNRKWCLVYDTASTTVAQEDVDTIEETLSGHTSSISTINTEIDSLETSVNTIESNISGLETSIEENSESIADITARLDALRVWTLEF